MTSKSLLAGEKHTKPTKIHFLAIMSVALGKLGDSVEFLLPAIITQPVSCEISVSKEKEYVLALIQFASAGIFSIISIPFLKKYPRRPTILFSLYLSIISDVVCATVPNYASLLLSRIFIGITIAFSRTPLSMYIAEISPNKDFHAYGVILSSLGWNLGGAWCGILGYILLDLIGWFVVLTSVPLFVMPITAFQFFLPETYTLDKEYIRLKNNSEGSETKVTTSKMAMISRIVKTVLLNAFPGFPFYGSILLIPNILKEDNIKHD